MYGRGRGRGRFGGGAFKRGVDKPFECFPDIELPNRNCVTLDTNFASFNYKLQSYWESSAYFIGEAASEKSHSNDIERYSDVKRPRNQFKQQSLSDYMKLEPGYFPLELVQGVKVRRAPKKVKWSADTDSKKLDFLEKLDSKSQVNKEKGDEEEEEEEQEDEEFSDDGDYEQNFDFDDDEDDYNDDDGGDDEPFY